MSAMAQTVAGGQGCPLQAHASKPVRDAAARKVRRLCQPKPRAGLMSCMRPARMRACPSEFAIRCILWRAADIRPAVEPIPRNLAALRSSLSMKSRLRSNFEKYRSSSARAHVHMLVVCCKILVARVPVIDLLYDVQPFVARLLAHPFVHSVLDLRIGFGRDTATAANCREGSKVQRARQRLQNSRTGGFLRGKAIPAIARPLDLLTRTQRGQRSCRGDAGQGERQPLPPMSHQPTVRSLTDVGVEDSLKTVDDLRGADQKARLHTWPVALGEVLTRSGKRVLRGLPASYSDERVRMGQGRRASLRLIAVWQSCSDAKAFGDALRASRAKATLWN